MSDPTLILDSFLNTFSKQVNLKYNSQFYRKIPLSLSINHDLGNRIISDLPTIQRIVESEKEVAQWDGLIADRLEKYEQLSTSSFLDWIKNVVLDVSRYFKYILGFKKNHSSDFCFFITNRKFFRYTEGVRVEMESRGYSVHYLFWNPKDAAKTDLPENSVLGFRLPFPKVWTKSYWNFRNFSMMEDRIAACAAAIGNRKTLVVEGCLLEHHMLGQYLKFNNQICYCLQWGYFGKSATKMGWRNMPYHHFLSWGDFFSSEFQLYNPDLRITSVGHPGLAPNKPGKSDKVILFAVQRTMEQHITNNDLKAFVQLAVIFARHKTDYKVKVRSHPDFSIPEEWKEGSPENLEWQDYKDFTLGQSLSGSRYCVSISSTLSIEALSYEVYPIFVRLNDAPLQVHATFAMLSEGQHVFFHTDLIKGIEQLDQIDRVEKLAKLRKDMFGALGTQAIDKIVSQITAD